jgi:hypothetical protein
LTIAACYVSPEGVVLGADSTTSYGGGQEPHYYNYSQKLFEIGEEATVGVVTWGLGGLAVNSYRRLFAMLADEITTAPAGSVEEIADKWATLFWPEYDNSPFLKEFKVLAAKPAYDPGAATPISGARNKEEEELFNSMNINLIVGFCIGGYVKSDRKPAAYSMLFSPTDAAKPTAVQAVSGFNFWGAPNMIKRLIFGHDEHLKNSIISSGKWSGTEPELDQILSQFNLNHPFTLPIQDAVDFVYSCIYSTIKALKFSNLSQICGGPIEIAVITADRPFRWVCHKAWDSAIQEGRHEPLHHAE